MCVYQYLEILGTTNFYPLVTMNSLIYPPCLSSSSCRSSGSPAKSSGFFIKLVSYSSWAFCGCPCLASPLANFWTVRIRLFFVNHLWIFHCRFGVVVLLQLKVDNPCRRRVLQKPPFEIVIVPWMHQSRQQCMILQSNSILFPLCFVIIVLLCALW